MPEEFVPRDWQKRFVRTYQTNRKKNFLLEACISAGKTAGSLYAFVSMRSTRELSFLVVVVPAEHLMRQYGQDAFKLFGLNLHCSGTDKRMGRVPTPSELLNSGYHGLVISYQWLTKSDNAEFLAKAIEKDVPGKVFVILDEVHHASEKLAFGQACETAFPDRIIPHRLMTSGTPFRSDNNRILGNWLTYEQVEQNTYECRPDFRYTLAKARNERIIPAFSFVTMDGEFTYSRNGWIYNGKTFDTKNERELTDALNTAIKVDGGWVKSAILWAHKRMQRDRERGIPECATYVRAADINAAYQMKKRIHSLTSEDALVVVSNDDDPYSNYPVKSQQDSSELIKNFAAETGLGAKSWIIGVGMLGEGVSIHRLKYRIHATNVRTSLSFIQDLGRLLRLFPEDEPEPVETLIPAHPTLIELAKDVLNQVPHTVQEKEENFEEDDKGSKGDGANQQPVASTFVPIASTGEMAKQIVDGEEIDSEYASVAEWLIENKSTWKDWHKTPAHLEKFLMEDNDLFELYRKQYEQAINKRANSHGNYSTYIPPGFPSEYATFLPTKKISFASKQVNTKVYRLACILFSNSSQEERSQQVKQIHSKAKLRNNLPLNGFIGHEGWERIYEWICDHIANAQKLKGMDDL